MTTDPQSPLTLAEFAARLDRIGGFEARPRLAVGVSGGADSMALMLLADRWARERGGEAWGFIVDHGLRPESAAEAGTVAGLLGARGVRCKILVWSGAKPKTGIQEAAREARYRLLAEWCRETGVLHLLTAHHQQDQVETYLIRRRAGSGIDGLAGMSAVRELRGCRLLRPLLSVPPERLRALLDGEGQPFLDDPSNRDPGFERSRLRRSPATQGPSLSAALAELQACAAARVSREQELAAALARTVALHPAGFASIGAFAFAELPAELGERLLARVALCIGAQRYPARLERVARLRAELLAHPGRARTLGGCRFVPWRDRILVLRELAMASPPMRLEPGDTIEWDRRFTATSPPAAKGAFILDYLGRHPGALAKQHRQGVLPPLLHQALPACWDEDGIAAVPGLGYLRPGVDMLPLLSFMPLNPLAPDRFTVV